MVPGGVCGFFSFAFLVGQPGPSMGLELGSGWGERSVENCVASVALGSCISLVPWTGAVWPHFVRSSLGSLGWGVTGAARDVKIEMCEAVPATPAADPAFEDELEAVLRAASAPVEVIQVDWSEDEASDDLPPPPQNPAAYPWREKQVHLPVTLVTYGRTHGDVDAIEQELQAVSAVEHSRYWSRENNHHHHTNNKHFLCWVISFLAWWW